MKWDKYHIDILTANFVLHPDWFDVVVGSNLFGDILSDLGPACTGTIGIAPSGNINPEGNFPSVFEPVHGSAPDIAGQGIANPIGMIWSGAMMLEHLGQKAGRSLHRHRDRAHARRTHAAHKGSRRQCRHGRLRQGGRGDGGVGGSFVPSSSVVLARSEATKQYILFVCCGYGSLRAALSSGGALRRLRARSDGVATVHPFAILRQCSQAAWIRFSLASGVRNAEWADSVTFGSLVSG